MISCLMFKNMVKANQQTKTPRLSSQQLMFPGHAP